MTAPVQAQSITVSGNCTLPDAIFAANTNAASGGCKAGSGADTITLTYNVQLRSRDKQLGHPKGLEVTSDITINGGGFTIRNGLGGEHGRTHSRLFQVKAGGRLTVRYAYLTGGNFFNPTDTTPASEIGGAIVNEGHLTIDHCYVSEYTAAFGGAIHSRGTLVIKGSAFAGNVAKRGGGGIYATAASILAHQTLSEIAV